MLLSSWGKQKKSSTPARVSRNYIRVYNIWITIEPPLIASYILLYYIFYVAINEKIIPIFIHTLFPYYRYSYVVGILGRSCTRATVIGHQSSRLAVSSPVIVYTLFYTTCTTTITPTCCRWKRKSQ